jgi:hypothetical protein
MRSAPHGRETLVTSAQYAPPAVGCHSVATLTDVGRRDPIVAKTMPRAYGGLRHVPQKDFDLGYLTEFKEP